MQYIVSYRYRFPLLPSVSADVVLVIGQPSFLLGVSFFSFFLKYLVWYGDLKPSTLLPSTLIRNIMLRGE